MYAYTLVTLKVPDSTLLSIPAGTPVELIGTDEHDTLCYFKVKAGCKEVRCNTPLQNIVVFDSPLEMAGA